MAENTIQVSIEVDDNGSVKVRNFGKAGKAAGAEVEKGFKNAGKSIGDFDRVVAASVNSVKLLAAGLIALLAAFGLGGLADIADQYTMIEGRIKLVTSSTAEATAVQRELYTVAQSSRSLFTATADVYSRFAQATKGTSVTQRELLSMTETLNKAFVISGASTEEANSAMIQLSQGFSSGVLRGEEFNAVMESGGRIVDMLTDYLGVNRGELRSMAEEGLLTSDVLRNALADGAAKVNEEFDSMPLTIDQAITGLKNASGAVIDWLNDTTGASAGIAESIQWITGVIEEIPAFVGWAAGESMIAWDGFVRNWEIAAQTIKSIIFVAFDEITETIADALARIFTALDNLPFVELSGSVDSYVESLRGLSGASEAYETAIARINREHDVTIKSYRQTQAEMTSQTAGLDSITSAAGTASTALDDLTDKTEKSGKAAVEAGQDYVSFSQELFRMRDASVNAGSQLLLLERHTVDAGQKSEKVATETAAAIEKANKEAADAIKKENERASEASQALWEQFATDTGSIIEDFIGGTLKGEFDSIGDLFQGLLDSMLDMLVSFLAKAAANDLINYLFGTGASGSSSLSLVGTGSSLLSSLFSSEKTPSQDASGSSSVTGAAGSVTSLASTAYSAYEYFFGGSIAAEGGAGEIIGGQLVEQGFSQAVSEAAAQGAAQGAAEGAAAATAETSAAGSSAAGTGLMSAGMVYAFAAAVAIKAITGFASGPSTKDDTRLNRNLQDAGVSGGALLGTFSGGLTEISNPLKEMLPALADYEKATASLTDGILTLTKSAEDSGGAMTVTALQYDATTGKFKSLGGTMNQLDDAIGYVASGSGTLTTAFIQQMAASYGLESSTAALIDKYLGAEAATQYLATGATTAAQAVTATSAALGSLQANSEHSSTAILGIVGSLRAAQAAASTGQTILNGDGAIYRYHALGGIMTQPTAFHVDIGGERGVEAILPLHAGPDTVRKMDAKLDRILAGRNDSELKSLLVEVVKHTQKTANVLRKFDFDGMPTTREASA